MNYKINEIFYSLQGEGFHAGTPAVFVRFSGCNLHCSFCDTDFTDYVRMDADEIVQNAVALVPKDSLRHQLNPMVVLTGGEPTLQVNAELIDKFHAAGFNFVTMESNGTALPPNNLDWLTVSPKESVKVDCCQELKCIFDGKSDPERWKINAEHYFLQPCDLEDDKLNSDIIQRCIDYIMNHPRWRLSLQIHKLVGIR
ncbi:MAG: 7-carboxy-7-deazaguanine synthase QueE [Prevotella sp.]|jgi:7-carboxy-7-deazaguanine synthase